MEIISSSIVIAMVVNMIMLLPYYNTLKEKGKPFSCSYCMGFWCALFIGAFGLHSLSLLQMVLVTLCAPYLSVLFERVLASLPVKL